MKLLVLFSIAGLAASAILPDYNYQSPGETSHAHDEAGHSSGITFGHDDFSGQGISTDTFVSDVSSSDVSFGEGIATSLGTSSHGSTSGSFVDVGRAASVAPCGGDQVRHVDGRCVTPRVNRRIFVYDVPANVQTTGSVNVPEPRVETNILLIRTPEGGVGPEPIVIPPPRQNHVVYILNKQSSQGQAVIEVPSGPLAEPEVYFVNYAEGENPVLPNGQDLQSALLSASQGAGQNIGSVGQSRSVVEQVFDDHSSSVGITHSSSDDSQFIGSTQSFSTGDHSSDIGSLIRSEGQDSTVGGEVHGSFIFDSSLGDGGDFVASSSVYSLP
ncbi:uncharacterized protein LOC134770892 [Penaeus indicus]|uniref:uncharacterized protein LOC134770892 n=1 Tax=Penaeus indicus TaxID=29960 RepID=UPI00300C0F9E